MRRTRSILPAAASVVTAALALAAMGSGLSGPPPNAEPPNPGPPPKADPGGPAPPTPGVLVLHGEIVPGPYRVAIVDDAIRINDRPIAAEDVPPAVTVALTPTALARHQVVQAFDAAKPVWRAEDGPDGMKEHAVDFMRRQPLVVSADLDDGGDYLRVQFAGERDPEFVNLGSSRRTRPLAEVRRRHRQDQVAALRFWLDHGSLVVIDRGVLFATAPGEGAETLRALRDVAARGGDDDAKTAAMRQIIPDPALARRLATRLGQGGGS